MIKIFIGSDHAGFKAKEHIIKILDKLKLNFMDLGTFDQKPIGYPIIAKKVCEKVLEDKCLGILICGSGEGMQIAANRFKGIRADLCYDEYSAKMARLDNNSNILCLRGREFDFNLYEIIIKTFFNTKFSGKKRHIDRINSLDNLGCEKLKINNCLWVKDWVRKFTGNKISKSVNMTLQLLKEGNSIDQIITLRKFKEDSIQRQIYELLYKGYITINDILEDKKIDYLKQKINNDNILSIQKIKDSLDDKISYFDIKSYLADYAREY